MKLDKKIKDHFKNLKFSSISRLDLKDHLTTSQGYIIGFSKKLVLLQETDDFRLLGFNVIERSKIESIRYNENDEFYDKIMRWEGQLKKVGLKKDLSLKNWKQLFKDLKKRDKKVIVEQEGKKYNSFVIGIIERVKNENVHIRYFDATGILDEEPTIINYKSITKVTFDDRYVNVFGKYIREQK